MTRAAAGPLGGVTVLDLCSYLAGPYGCTLLADLGASVIKIESPQGDMLRQFPSSLAGDSRFFLGANRGKRALALDLKQPEGLAVLHRMVERADVLVENFRPSVPARLGIDYPRLKAINSRLVYCSLTGYGDSGPLSEKGGFDQVLQCLSGIAVFQGTAAGTPQVVLGSVLDYFTSAMKQMTLVSTSRPPLAPFVLGQLADRFLGSERKSRREITRNGPGNSGNVGLGRLGFRLSRHALGHPGQLQCNGPNYENNAVSSRGCFPHDDHKPSPRAAGPARTHVRPDPLRIMPCNWPCWRKSAADCTAIPHAPPPLSG
jgi:CoA-transferase family III